MKIQSINFFLIFLTILLTACQSTSVANSESTPLTTQIKNASQTKNDVALTITNVTFSEKDTLVTFVVKVPPQWGLDINAFPPQQALHNNSVLIDETGRQHTLVSGTYGLPQLDTETGGVEIENTVTFGPIKSQTVIFQTEIEISEIPISQPVAISILDRKVLDSWSINQGITFSSFTDVPGSVKLLSRDDNKIELEFTFNRVTSGDLKLGCLTFYSENWDTTDNARECLSNETRIIAKVGMDSPKDEISPILFHVTANAAFVEPFNVSWSAMSR